MGRGVRLSWSLAALLAPVLHVAAVAAAAGGYRVSHLEHEVLDARDPSWRDAVREANEISELSDEIERTQMMIDDWTRKHEQARQYHEGQKQLIKEQIATRKQQKGLQKEELTNYEKEREEYYTYQMCALLLDGFFFDKEQDKRIHILHLCMGRKSLALAASPKRRLRRGPHRKVPRTWDDVMMRKLGRGLDRIGHEVHALLVAEHRIERRVVSPKLRKRLARLKAELKAARQQYHDDQVKWRAERAELNKEEDGLGDNVNANFSEKQAMKKRAWAKVKGNFCPVIDKYYGIDEEKIVEHAMKECV